MPVPEICRLEVMRQIALLENSSVHRQAEQPINTSDSRLPNLLFLGSAARKVKSESFYYNLTCTIILTLYTAVPGLPGGPGAPVFPFSPRKPGAPVSP